MILIFWTEIRQFFEETLDVMLGPALPPRHGPMFSIIAGGERIPLDPKSGGLLNAAAAAAEVPGQVNSVEVVEVEGMDRFCCWTQIMDDDEDDDDDDVYTMVQVFEIWILDC